MINILFSSQFKFLGLVLLSALFLQGCGGERTTPYNPSVSSSSSSASSVGVSQLTQGTFIYRDADHKDKRLQVIRDADDFYGITNSYVDFNLTEPNFTSGQVVLVDLGKQDSCQQSLEFNSLRAEAVGDDSVKVVVTYRERAVTTGACIPVSSRPFYLYYVQSRGTLIFEESLL